MIGVPVSAVFTRIRLTIAEVACLIFGQFSTPKRLTERLSVITVFSSTPSNGMMPSAFRFSGV
ncbi:hypothetical protein D3C87_2145890 [compost metagenome]